MPTEPQYRLLNPASWILGHRSLLVLILLLNLSGSVWGFIWYENQLRATPWYWWLFTPECPIQSLLFSLVLILRLRATSWSFLEAFAFPGLVKYGFWTVSILTFHWSTGGVPDLQGIALFAAHLGMVMEGLLFLPLLSPPRYYVLLVGPWFALMDFLDYGVGIHPYLPGPNQTGVALTLAVLGTIGVGLYTLKWLRPAPLSPSSR